jgi:hypothetical protein
LEGNAEDAEETAKERRTKPVVLSATFEFLLRSSAFKTSPETTQGWAGAIEESSVGGTVDETRMMQRMNWALDRLVEDPKRVVLHLEARSPETDEPAPNAPAQP